MHMLFKRLTTETAKGVVLMRMTINKIFYVFSLIAYMVLWYYIRPIDTPQPAFFVGFLLAPLCIFGLYVRAYYYVFIFNWFTAFYYLVCAMVYIYTMSFFNHLEYFKSGYGIFEIKHLFFANVIGVVVAIAVGFPFKVIHYLVLDANKFLFKFSILDDIEDQAFPEKKAQKKQKLLYNTLNETQLQIELKTALKEERFEDAEKIKSILETKFK